MFFSKWLLAIAIVVAISSCNNNKKEEPSPYKKMEDLVVSNDFDWSTTKSAKLTVRAADNLGDPVKGAKIIIYTKDPEEGGKMITSGLTDASGVFSVNYDIPAYYTQLFVTTDYIGLPKPGLVDLDQNGFDILLGGKPEKTSFKSIVQANSTNANYKFLGNYNSQGVPDYLEPDDDPIDRQFLNDVNNTLPERVWLTQSHPQYFSLDYDHNLHLSEACDVWVTFVSEGAGYRNVLGFYTYTTGNAPQSPSDIDSITIIYPNVSFQGSGGGLHSGNKVHIGQFPANTTISFALMANGWKNGTVTDGNWIVYSQRELNPEADPNLQQHSVLLSDNGRDLMLLGFEDIRRDRNNCDHDFNDAVFYVTANPIQAVDQTSLPPVDYTGTDSDGDNVPDHFDDFPNDPTRAFNNYYFDQGDFGTLAFEDMWPAKGDYDFNDAVIDYNFNQVTNGDNKVVEIYGTFVFRAQGAYFHNGFGFELPIDNNLVAQVSGDLNVPGNIVSLDSRNLENGQTNAVVILWEDGYDLLPHPGNGVGVNTELDAPYVDPDTVNVHITFTQPIDLYDIGNPPYNPFLIVNGQRGVEVHLIDHAPTDLADPGLFGQDADNSDPANGRYYRTKTNLPWAINVIEHFDYPVEKVEITNAYLKFAEWAESSGQISYDWYKDLSGYRNSENIYQVPADTTR